MVQKNDFKLIKCGNLIDCTGNAPVKNGAILLEGSKIKSIGHESNVIPPEGANIKVYDYSKYTVMPGMVDCHTHNNGFGDGRLGEELNLLADEILTLQSIRNLRASLFSGVTTIRENGPKNFTLINLKKASNDYMVLTPRMLICGRPLSIIGGHMGYFGSEVTGIDEVRAETRNLIKQGADYIKITATGGSTQTSFRYRHSFNLDELNAITSEARKFGKLTATHCVSTQGIVNSIKSDVDMIIHCMFNEPDGSNKFRPEIVDDLFNKGTYINPTLHVVRATIWDLLNIKERIGLTGSQEKLLDDRKRDFDIHLNNCKKMIDNGLKFITGSDSSWSSYQSGNTVYETECLNMAGLSNMASLLSVTKEAAKSLDIDDLVGTLEIGKEADLLVLNSNPLEDISNLWDVKDVFLAGRYIDRGSEKSLKSVRQLRPSLN